MAAAELSGRSAVAILLAVPVAIAAFAILGPFATDALPLFSGLARGVRPGLLPGYGTIDPNMGFTADALGIRAALDLVSGRLPLWNHFEGLGAPLLGEMQSAALFPPTLLLLLPHGQVLEQALLQVAAGVGTYLFLRRFGLGAAAALAGGLLFELNGTFAWLRNAIYLPIAFLPWLFLALETLFVQSGASFRRRWPAIVLGAIAAALAITAGFPEVVYFYSLLLLLWAAARALSLPPGRALGYAGDLMAMALLAALLAAPTLLAFAHFLPEAELGGHRDDLFQGATLPGAALVMIWLPYLYGPVVGSPNPEIQAIWNGIGGYLGLMPLLLALFGLATAWRRPIVWLPAAWAVAAIGVSHGAPGLHAAFLHLPLATIAAYARYLDPSWLFCAAVLAATGLDRLPLLSRRTRLGAGGFALTVAIVVVGAALGAAAPLLATLWAAKQHQRLFAIVSLGVAAALATGFAVALPRRQARLWLTLGLGLEALAAFTLPILSFPRIAGIDRSLVDFLQLHAGLQRTALASLTGLIPNYGSAFGIPTINYDDLPIPARTVDYIHAALDPDASVVSFRPDGRAESAADHERRRQLFVAHLPGYGQAGVRYLIGDADLFAIPAYAQENGPAPLALEPGQSLRIAVDTATASALRGILVRVGTYGGLADGRLHARLCQDDTCAEGTLDLAAAADNRAAAIDFPSPITLHSGPYALTLAHDGGSHRVALWSRDTPGAARTIGTPEPHLVPELALLQPSDPAPVFASAAATVFELPAPRPYASADGCTVDPLSQDRIRARCDQPSRLLRLEVSLAGWSARVDGRPAPILLAERTFQSVDLPAGASLVEFAYDPPLVRPALAVAAVTLLLLLLSLPLTRRQTARPSPASQKR